MKLSISFLWTILIAVSVLFSCTVEKRLYQRGYHVEWHKRARPVNETGTNAEKQVSDQVMLSDEKQTEAITATSSTKETITTFEEETPQYSLAVSTPQDEVTGTSGNSTAATIISSDQSTETIERPHELKPLLKKFSRPETGPSGVTKGLLMILMGLLLILMGFVFQNILGVFGTILLIIFGLGGAIMIVVGIVIMILG